MDQVWHVAGVLLRGLRVLQLVPPAVLAEAAVGAVRVVRLPDGADHRGRGHHNVRPAAAPRLQPPGVDRLDGAGPHRARRVPELRAGRHQPRPEVQRPH